MKSLYTFLLVLMIFQSCYGNYYDDPNNPPQVSGGAAAAAAAS